MSALLALLSAAVFGISVALQQRSAAAVPSQHALRIGLLTRLVDQPLWLLGVGASGAGILLQLLALRHGSLVVVQPLLTSYLVFALGLVAWWSGQRLSGREWRAVLAVVAGLALFLALAAPSGTSGTDAPLRGWLVLVAVVVPLVGAASSLALRTTGRARATRLGLATGLVNGLVAVLMKTFAADLTGGGVAALGDWPFWALAGVGAPALLLNQTVYQTGFLGTSLPLIAVTDAIFAGVVAVTLFHDRIAMGPIEGAVVALALAFAARGLWTLARDPLIAGPAGGAPRRAGGGAAAGAAGRGHAADGSGRSRAPRRRRAR